MSESERQYDWRSTDKHPSEADLDRPVAENQLRATSEDDGNDTHTFFTEPTDPSDSTKGEWLSIDSEYVCDLSEEVYE